MFEDELNKLKQCKEDIIRYAAFVESSINYPSQEKIQGSYSGHIVQAQISGNTRLCVMAICRFWDRELPLTILRKCSELSLSLEAWRKFNHPDWPDESIQYGTLQREVNQTLQTAQNFVGSQEFGHIRTFRTEHLAHNDIGPSRDRTKYLGETTEPETTYSQVIDAGKLSIEVFDRIVSHIRFHIENSEDTYTIVKRYADAYWDALPEFSKVENEQIVFGELSKIPKRQKS